MNAASRSDPVAGLDIFADDLNCYAGKVEYYKWKLVGEGNDPGAGARARTRSR